MKFSWEEMLFAVNVHFIFKSFDLHYEPSRALFFIDFNRNYERQLQHRITTWWWAHLNALLNSTMISIFFQPKKKCLLWLAHERRSFHHKWPPSTFALHSCSISHPKARAQRAFVPLPWWTVCGNYSAASQWHHYTRMCFVFQMIEFVVFSPPTFFSPIYNGFFIV